MSTSEIHVVDPTSPPTNFVDPAATSYNILMDMRHNRLINERFNNTMLQHNFAELAEDFIASSEGAIANIAKVTHSSEGTGLASAMQHAKVLLKTCKSFGAEEMAQHCRALKGYIRTGKMDAAREGLESLILTYDQLKVSMFRWFAVENMPLNFSSEQVDNMNMYKTCVNKQLGTQWERDQMAATAAETVERQDALLVQQAQSAMQAAIEGLAEANEVRNARKGIAKQAKAALAAAQRKHRASDADRISKVVTADGPSADTRRRSFGGGPSDVVPCLRRGLSVGGSRREITGDNRPPKKGLSSFGCGASSKCCIM